MCAHICTDVIWRSFCPFMLTNEKSNFVGIFVAILHPLHEKECVKHSTRSFFEGLSNLFGLVSMVLVSTITLYVDTVSVDLPLKVVKGVEGSCDCGALDRYSIPSFTPLPCLLCYILQLWGIFCSYRKYCSCHCPRHAFIKYWKLGTRTRQWSVGTNVWHCLPHHLLPIP